MRGCKDLECRGDFTWCNRAEAENAPLPVQDALTARDALRVSAERIRGAKDLVNVSDARRVLCALDCAEREIARLREQQEMGDRRLRCYA